MYPITTQAYSDWILPACTGLAQELAKPCLMVEASSGSSLEGPKKRE